MENDFHISADHLYDMLRFIKIYMMNIGFSQKQSKEIELAAEEALLNVIRYSGLPTTDTLKIACLTTSPQGLKIVVTDGGKPFNPLQAAHTKLSPNQLLEQLEPGGFGILLMKKHVDEIQYSFDQGYNVLTLIKYVAEEET